MRLIRSWCAGLQPADRVVGGAKTWYVAPGVRELESMDSVAVAARLREIATYLELEGDRFRAQAYQKAAGSVEAAANLDRLISERRLTELPRIGESLARTIE